MTSERLRRCFNLLLCTIALGHVGCAEEMKSEAPTLPSASTDSEMPIMGMMSAAPTPAAPSTERSAPTPPGADDPLKSALADRKIVYNANVSVVTEDIAALEARLNVLVSAHKAYIADTDRTGSAGASRRGTWKVRVPVERFDAFLKGAVGLGELVNLRTDSQDVSEEYYDLDARQNAKKIEEARLLKHLTDSTGKLEDILAVERELARVRGEIERMQGRLRVLSNLTTLATVTVVASEIKNYVPPQAPTLKTKVARAFSASLESLKKFGEATLLVAVAALPWLPVILLALIVALWAGRRLRRSRAGTHA